MKGEEVLFGYDNITICLYTHTHTDTFYDVYGELLDILGSTSLGQETSRVIQGGT